MTKMKKLNKYIMKRKFNNQILSSAILLLVTTVFLYGISACKQNTFLSKNNCISYSIPVGGNSWVVNDLTETSNIVNENAIQNWSSATDTINTYFQLDTIGEIKIGFRGKVLSGKSKIEFTLNGKTRTVSLENTQYDTLYIGKFEIAESGYQCLHMNGIKKSGEFFAEISEFFIAGESTKGVVNYVRDDFYWGKRGPSVHLTYSMPEGEDQVKWFYNEMTIPEGEDVLGSYFMANGFGQGYFGIQVNSDTERRVLFSVWSPFHTDNPDEIPDDQKIVLLKKGAGVYTGEFGNEGSGGQSYLKHNWKAGITYKFLLKGEPVGKNHSVFTAYFFDPEINKWLLIASFKRPETNVYLTRFHSFLENFYTETGFVSRKVIYENQWVANAKNDWFELTQAKFTADATARKNARLDYTGGYANDAFYLKNCGFFNENTQIGEIFKRKSTGRKPIIDFSELE